MSRLTVEEAAGIRGWLARTRFKHVSTAGEESASFGDRQDIWERDGTLFRLTEDRGHWWCDLSRTGAEIWLDVDGVAGALGSTSITRVERVADLSWSIRDLEFKTLCTIVRSAPDLRHVPPTVTDERPSAPAPETAQSTSNFGRVPSRGRSRSDETDRG